MGKLNTKNASGTRRADASLAANWAITPGAMLIPEEGFPRSADNSKNLHDLRFHVACLSCTVR